MNKFKKKFIGDAQFYSVVLSIMVPMVIQQFITNFVSLLDNIMVGALGTESISAVAIVNQLMSVVYLGLFGGTSGISIFSSQFYGKGDMEGMRHSIRTKFYFGFLITSLGIIIFKIFGADFINMFLQGSSDGGDMELAFQEAMKYLNVAVWGCIPFMLVTVLSTSLREAGDAKIPMYAGFAGIATNLTGNYILIYGNFGAPAMGVTGAAIATNISRIVELSVVSIYAFRKREKHVFFKGLLASPYVPVKLIFRIVPTALPLLCNELLWSLGNTVITQSYSSKGLNAVAAVNINQTVWNLFSVLMMGCGSAISILVGQKLGAGKIEEAKDMDTKLIFLSVSANFVIGIILALLSPFIPLIYNVSQDVRNLATAMLIITGLSMPIHAATHSEYFTIRSGGQTLITMFFDGVYTWVVRVALSRALCYLTNMPIVQVFFCVSFVDIIEVVIGYFMIRTGFWAKNIVND